MTEIRDKRQTETRRQRHSERGWGEGRHADRQRQIYRETETFGQRDRDRQCNKNIPASSQRDTEKHTGHTLTDPH